MSQSSAAILESSSTKCRYAQVSSCRILIQRSQIFGVAQILSIVEERNIGEVYFEYLAPDASRSRDLFGAGPVADDAADVFDLFWNSQWTAPVEMAVDPIPNEAEASSFRLTLEKSAGLILAGGRELGCKRVNGGASEVSWRRNGLELAGRGVIDGGSVRVG